MVKEWRRPRVVGAVVSALVSTTVLTAGPAMGASVGASTVPSGTSAPAGFVPRSITRVVGADTVVVAGSAPCGHQACAILLTGSVGPSGLVRGWHRLGAPPIAPARDALALNIGDLSFVNGSDGYDLVAPTTPGGASLVYATVDGGRTWRRASVTSGTVLSLVAGSAAFYAVTARCGRQGCQDYRLAWSAAGSSLWSSTPVPPTPGLDESGVGLAVQGQEVLLNFDPPVKDGQPHLLVAPNGHGPFSAHLVPRLASIGACDLSPEPGGAVWAACPTGMLVSYYHSPAPAGPYRPFWDYAGTGGGGLVPVTGTVAYRYTGVAQTAPEKLPADTLQRSTNAGLSFTDAGTWPFAHNVGTAPQFLFLDERDGFGLGPAPQGAHEPEVLETADAGRRWVEVLP